MSHVQSTDIPYIPHVVYTAERTSRQQNQKQAHNAKAAKFKESSKRTSEGLDVCRTVLQLIVVSVFTR